MAPSGNADAVFTYDTNVEAVARRIAEGTAKIEASLNSGTSKVGRKFLDRQRDELNNMLRQKAAEADALTRKYASGQGIPGRSFSQEQARIGQELNKSISGAFRDALAQAPASLPTGKLRELFSTLAKEAFGGLREASPSDRRELRRVNIAPETIGKSQGYGKAQAETQRFIDNTERPVPKAVKKTSTLVDKQQSDQEKASADAASSAKEIADDKRRQAKAERRSAEVAEARAKREEQQYRAVTDIRDEVRAGRGRNLYGTRKYAELDGGKLVERETGKQITNPITKERIYAEESESVDRRIRANTKEAASAEKLVAAEQELLRVQQLRIAKEQGLVKNIGGEGGRYSYAPSSGQVFRNQNAQEVFGPEARAQAEKYARELDRAAEVERAKTRRGQEAAAAVIAAQKRLQVALELQAEMARGRARFISPGSPVIQRDSDQRFYRPDGAGGYGSNVSDLQNRRYAATLESTRAKEVRQQERVNEALQKKADDYNRQGLSQNFLSGLTSRGFSGKGGGFSGSFDGLAQTAGVTAKYAATSAVLFTLVGALKQVGTEYLDFVDSQTELNISLGQGTDASGTFVNALTDIASQAGSNVGEAMDVAASGIRGFKDQTDESIASTEALGLAFEKQAARIAVLAKTDLKDAGGNLKAASLAFDIKPDDAGFARVTDALVGAKRIGGGDEKEISQGIASAGVAAKQAGFEINEFSILVSRVQAQTDQSGAAVGQSFSRAFSIIGGSQGRSAIQSLNQSLAETDKIDVTSSVRNQILQLSKVFPKLTTAQIQPLINSLGGTASFRQVTILLKEANALIGDQATKQVEVGEGAKEYRQRLEDLTKTLLNIKGELKAIAVNVTSSGILTIVGVAITALDKVLGILSKITGAIKLVPTGLRDAVGAALGLYAAFKLITGIQKAGGFGALLSATEKRVSPGRAVARATLAESARAENAGRLSGANVLSTVRDTRTVAAADRVAASSALFKTTQEGVAARTAAAAARLDAANVNLAAVQGRGAAAIAAATAEVAAAEAAQAQVLTQGAGLMRQSAAELNAANEALVVIQREAAVQQRAVQAATQLGDKEIAAARANEAAIRTVANARLAEGLLTQAEVNAKVTAAGAQLGNAIIAADARVAAAGAAAGLRAAPSRLSQLAATQLRNPLPAVANFSRRFNPVVPPIARIAAEGFQAGGVRGVGAALKVAAADVLAGGKRINVAFNEAGALVRAGASRAGAANAAGGGLAGKFGAQGGSLTRLGKGALGLAGGGLGVAMIAGFAAYELASKNTEINKSVAASRGRVDTLVDTSSITALRDAAANLKSGADQLTESSSGLTGTLVNFYRGDPVGKQAENERAAAARNEQLALTLERIKAKNASSTDDSKLAQTIDLSSPTGVADGFATLVESGRNAATQARALSLAIDEIGKSSKNTVGVLSEAEQATFAQDYSTRVVKELRDVGGLLTAGLPDGKRSGGGRKKRADSRRYRDAQVSGKILEDADYTALFASLDVTSKSFAKGKNLKDPAVRKELLKAQTANVTAQLDAINFSDDPEFRRKAIQSVLLAFGSVSKYTAAKTDVQLRAEALQAVGALPGAGQAAGQVKGLLSSLDPVKRGTSRAGDAVTAAKAELDYIVSESKKPQIVDNLDAEGLEALNVVIDQAKKALQVATAARIQTLAQYAANRRPQTDVLGRLDVQIQGVKKALASATGDDAEKLNDDLATLSQQRAVQVVQNANAERSQRGDTRDRRQTAKNELDNAAATLTQIANSGDTSSEAYNSALMAYRTKLQASMDLAVEQANTMISAAVAYGDISGQATAEATKAYNLAATALQGTPESAALWKAYNDARVAASLALVNEANIVRASSIDPTDALAVARDEYRGLVDKLAATPVTAKEESATLQAQISKKRRDTVDLAIERANAFARALLDPRDTVGNAQRDLVDVNATLAVTTDPTKRAQLRLQKIQAQLALAAARVAERNNALLATLDPRDTVRAARISVANAVRDRSLTRRGSTERKLADREVKNRQLEKAQADVSLANARTDLGVFSDSGVSEAAAALVKARRNLGITLKNTQGYYEALKATQDAQRALADAIAQAAQNAYLLTIDLTDPVAQAQAALKEAADKLARDRKAGAPKDVLDSDRVAQKQAANALEAAQFDDRLNKWDIADRLGRITHAQHMAYLQGEHDRLSAIVNRTYQQQSELDQVDLALKDIKDNINSAMSGQFNLGDIKVPTVYEVRRSLAYTSGGGAGGTVDNSTNNTTVYVNGADFAKVIEYLQAALGQTAQVTRGTGGRKP